MSARRQAAGSKTVARAPIALRFVSPKGRRSTATTPRDGRSDGGGRRPGAGNDAAVLGLLDSARLGCILLEREMRPRAVVVAEVAVQTTTQMSLVQDDHVVEELAADSADH